MKKCNTNHKWRTFGFKVKVMSYFCNQFVSKDAAFTLKANSVHLWPPTAWRVVSSEIRRQQLPKYYNGFRRGVHKPLGNIGIYLSTTLQMN